MIAGYPSIATWCADTKKTHQRVMSGSGGDGPSNPLVAVAVDKDKGSQNALKWAIENLVSKGQTIILVHVNTKGDVDEATCMKEVLIPFRCFCTRKDVKCKNVVLEDSDISKAIVEFVSQAAIEKLIVGSASRAGFVKRFKTSDTPTNISRGAPDFCTVYVITKGKVSSMRNAVRAAPTTSSFRVQMHNQPSIKPNPAEQPRPPVAKEPSLDTCSLPDSDRDQIRSPFMRGHNNYNTRSYGGELSIPDTDISFVSSGRPSIDRTFNQRLSNASDGGYDRSFDMSRTSNKSSDSYTSGNDFSHDSFSSQSMGDVEEEMKRLRLELKQTMDMYSTACKEALTAKQKAMELHRWKMEEEQRLQEARLSEEAALAMAETERVKCKAALEAAEASQRIAELEAQKRINAEKQALKESEERRKTSDSLPQNDFRYRRYSIEDIEMATDYFTDKRKIGEGGYGPVYKCYLDHTPVAIKVLRPDAAQGRSQFQQEVEILSCIRHPNMVLLLGACPEYGCLVYEYMASGSLEDRLFRRGNSPAIPWQHRFRIACEIGTGLLFLHQTKPEPLVHRDLKPANILLDRNYVSKISDVGLARLVPPSVADNVTQYRMTSAAGTFCYIDPEYQQTGMLGIKSDIYSLGIMLLQLVTGKPPMGLTHHVERSIERGKFEEMLDPTVPDWPVGEALILAQIALKCSELRRKDRPDLATVVLPELERLRALGEENMQHCILPTTISSPMHSQASMMSGPWPPRSGYDTSRSQSSTLQMIGR